MLAWDTKYPPKNDGAAAAVEASAPPPRTPDRPTTAANEPRNPFFFSASFSTFSASYMEISARLYQNLR